MAPIPSVVHSESIQHMRSVPFPSCYACGGEGDFLYHSLRDRYFAAPGAWNLKKCRNVSCGLVWLDPIPIAEDIGKAYGSYYTHEDGPSDERPSALLGRLKNAVKAGYFAYAYGYDLNGSKFPGLLAYLDPFRRSRLDFSVMYLPYRRCGRLLEVGCGSGSMLKAMADLGWQVEGIDLDPVAVEKSRSKGLEVRTGCLQDRHYPENYFDAITMSHLIEHVHDPLELLKTCHRMLKPGGSLVVVTPNIKSAGHRICGASWFHLDPPRHLRIFTANSLTALIQRAGFRSIKIGTTIRGAAHAYAASRSVRQTARYQWGSKQPLTASLWANAMQAVEWAWLKFDRQVGEEIAAIVQK
jgi:2-polyprenyl-3-methyl-5-hydroxy-6-metoxy-1,4-benzoquinol methylase